MAINPLHASLLCPKMHTGVVQICKIDPRVLAMITTKPDTVTESKSTLGPCLGGDGPFQEKEKTPPCPPYSEQPLPCRVSLPYHLLYLL